MDRVRQQVVDYLLGTLDDSEFEAVKGLLESDPRVPAGDAMGS